MKLWSNVYLILLNLISALSEWYAGGPGPWPWSCTQRCPRTGLLQLLSNCTGLQLNTHGGRDSEPHRPRYDPIPVRPLVRPRRECSISQKHILLVTLSPFNSGIYILLFLSVEAETDRSAPHALIAVEGQEAAYTEGKSAYASSEGSHHSHTSISHHTQPQRHLESSVGFGRDQSEYIYHGRGTSDGTEHIAGSAASASNAQQNAKGESSDMKFIQNNHMVNYNIGHTDGRAMHSGLESGATDGFSENHPTPHQHSNALQLETLPPRHQHLHLQTNEGKCMSAHHHGHTCLFLPCVFHFYRDKEILSYETISPS